MKSYCTLNQRFAGWSYKCDPVMEVKQSCGPDGNSLAPLAMVSVKLRLYVGIESEE